MTCTAIVERGTGRNIKAEQCGKPAAWVSRVGTEFCNRHANTKAGRAGQRSGFLVKK